MELKEFIKTVITDITGAVSELQQELDNGAVVNPNATHEIDSVIVGDVQCRKTPVNFDIAVQASSNEERQIKGKVGIKVVSAEGDKTRSESAGSVSRISFSLVVVLPTENKVKALPVHIG